MPSTDPLTPAELTDLREALAKATPGPWRAVVRDKELRLVVGADEGTVAWSGHGNKTRAEAHSVLIAAVPDLLAAFDAALTREAKLRAGLTNALDDLEAEIENRYQGLKDHPAMFDRYERDMSAAREGRALLTETEQKP